MKKSHHVSIIIGVVVLIIAAIGGLYFEFFGSNSIIKQKTSLNKEDLTQVIQNQNASKFLEFFDSDTTKSSLSKIGAKSILQDWNQNSTEDISKIPSILQKNGKVLGASNDYRIQFETKKKMFFFDESHLTTMTSKLIVPSKLKKATIAANGKSVSYKELTESNLFPGVYNFKIKLDGITSSQKVTVLGNGRSSTLLIPQKKKSEKVTTDSTKKVDSEESTQTNKAQNQTSGANDANNDPEYKEPSMISVDDLVGNWKLVDSQGNESGIMPDTITISRDNISTSYPHDIHTSTGIDTVRYSEEDDTNYFDGSDMIDPFAAKLVKKNINGKDRVALEHVDQGVYGWYLRQ